MIAIVDDTRERIAVAGMTRLHCRVLCTVIETLRDDPCPMIAETMADLMDDSRHWLFTKGPTRPPSVTLCNLTWNDVEVLDVILERFVQRGRGRLSPDALRLSDELLEMFDEAIETQFHDHSYEPRW